MREEMYAGHLTRWVGWSQTEAQIPTLVKAVRGFVDQNSHTKKA